MQLRLARMTGKEQAALALALRRRPQDEAERAFGIGGGLRAGLHQVAAGLACGYLAMQVVHIASGPHWLVLMLGPVLAATAMIVLNFRRLDQMALAASAGWFAVASAASAARLLSDAVGVVSPGWLLFGAGM